MKIKWKTTSSKTGNVYTTVHQQSKLLRAWLRIEWKRKRWPSLKRRCLKRENIPNVCSEHFVSNACNDKCIRTVSNSLKMNCQKSIDIFYYRCKFRLILRRLKISHIFSFQQSQPHTLTLMPDFAVTIDCIRNYCVVVIFKYAIAHGSKSRLLTMRCTHNNGAQWMWVYLINRKIHMQKKLTKQNNTYKTKEPMQANEEGKKQTFAFKHRNVSFYVYGETSFTLVVLNLLCETDRSQSGQRKIAFIKFSSLFLDN